MSQESVFKSLSENKWIDVKEIMQKTGLSRTPIDRALNKLFNYGEVMKKEQKDKNMRTVFVWRRR